MDETSVKIDIINNRTIEFEGVNRVPIKTTNSELLKYTVMLAGLSDGTKLSPAVIFSGSGKILKK